MRSVAIRLDRIGLTDAQWFDPATRDLLIGIGMMSADREAAPADREAFKLECAGKAQQLLANRADLAPRPGTFRKTDQP